MTSRDASHFDHAYLLGFSPDGVGVAHGRVNLIGEHIDYQGGTVLPMAIPQRAVVGVALSGDPQKDHIEAEGFGEAVARGLTEPSHHHWSDYVAGAVQKARALGWIEGGVRVKTHSDVPHGAGLSSSAAIIVATLKAILDACDLPVDNAHVARLAQEVEHTYIGMPCGIMDQMAVAIASPGKALSLDTDTLAHELVELPHDHTFAVVHSGISRRLEDGRYAARRRESDAAKDALGVDLLCKMSPEDASRIDSLAPPMRARARHTWSEHRRVLAATEALKSNDLANMGAIMNESHRSMRDDFEMTTPGIDALVAGACDEGAMGARLTGGGFGGCIVALVDNARLESWYTRLAAQFPRIYRVA